MMVSVESTGPLERKMRVQVPAEKIESEVRSRLQQVGRTAKIKGFRPGKVPAKVVQQRYGGQVRQEVLSEMMQKSYGEALAQEKLNPAGGPDIQPETMAKGEDFTYVATFEILPEVHIQGLDSIEVSRPVVEITDADVDVMLDNLRRQKGQWVTVDRKSADGDQVVVDFDGTLKGEAFPGGSGKEVPVVLGQGQMLPDFEKALYGIKAGDEKSFKVKFPKDYQAEDLAGKKAEFSIKVHHVQEQILPELDDEFAKEFGVLEGGVEALRRDVQANMEREYNEKVKADLKEQTMDGLLAANPIEIPKALHQEEMHNLQHDAMRRLGISDHAQAPPQENFRVAAERRVRLGLLVNELIRANGIVIDPERVKTRVAEICAGYEDPEALMSAYLGNPQVMAQIEPAVLEEQAVEWLMAQGKASEKRMSFKEYMNV